ncbi:MAG: alpha-amylase family glycosyl hydrolase, partial [Actinomycetota bacterium]
MQQPTRSWWRDALVYQVYVRSYADANGDGVGDLDGITSRLDHVASLGVDAIWLNPCYPSPQRDHGYDVADYSGIHDEYGDLDAFDRLLAGAHARGIKLLMDLVPNHCSSDHPFFVEALAGEPGSDARDRFWFRDGRPAGEDPHGAPPNNWMAAFGGSAWTRASG